MEVLESRRTAGLGILLVWCVYIAFALLTHWEDYGLVVQPEGRLRWIAIRLATVSIWLSVAAMLLLSRKHPVNWRSFLSSFVAAGVLATVVAPSLVPGIASSWAVAGTLCFYALVSGFLCVTVTRPAIAAGLGLVVFAAQLLADATAHTLSGGFRLH